MAGDGNDTNNKNNPALGPERRVTKMKNSLASYVVAGAGIGALGGLTGEKIRDMRNGQETIAATANYTDSVTGVLTALHKGVKTTHEEQEAVINDLKSSTSRLADNVDAVNRQSDPLRFTARMAASVVPTALLGAGYGALERRRRKEAEQEGSPERG